MGAIEEIERGITNRFLITPVSRAAIMNASVITNGVSIALQSAIIVVLGWAGGARYPGGIGGVAGVLLALGLLRSGLWPPFHTPRESPAAPGIHTWPGLFILAPHSPYFAYTLAPKMLHHQDQR